MQLKYAVKTIGHVFSFKSNSHQGFLSNGTVKNTLNWDMGEMNFSFGSDLNYILDEPESEWNEVTDYTRNTEYRYDVLRFVFGEFGEYTLTRGQHEKVIG